MPLNLAFHGLLKPIPAYSDDYSIHAFRWLEEAVGFYPLFMMVDQQGQQDAIVMTGYSRPEMVLFVFSEATIETQKAIFTDYWWWLCVLNSIDMLLADEPIEKRVVRSLFKKSWRKSRWYRYTQKQSVQVVVPQLDLRLAQEVWVHNKTAAQQLIDLGFNNVKVMPSFHYYDKRNWSLEQCYGVESREPDFIAYAADIVEADQLFQNQSGINPSKSSFIATTLEPL